MPAPIPVLKDTMPVVHAQDLEFIMGKLDRNIIVEMYASLGIAVQGTLEEILRYCAFSSPWDYAKTQKLREYYTLSFEANRLTGFLIEGAMNFSFEMLHDLLHREKQANRRDSQNDDDLRGIIEVAPENGMLSCRYKYKRERVKSDLSMFRDTSVDTRFFVYDTGRKWMVNRSLFCVAIQSTTSADYTKILNEFLQVLQSSPGSVVRVFSLKPKRNPTKNCLSLSFNNCDMSNQFMLDLLEKPILPNSQIRDIPTQNVFRWESDLSRPSGLPIEESENVEEDLSNHLQEIKMAGVALHKTKTAISALAGKKHAVSALGMVLRTTGYLCYIGFEFKTQIGRLDVKLEKVTEEDFSRQEQKVYDSQLYWDTLWQFWSELVDRYIEQTTRVNPA